ncbi:MAG: hypothetical protein DWQ36_10775 [Acidobacteria bacterium]|nr:MAG: hypothetical protein DWQ30_12630 [Acidobacteriota bacterium]REK07696.1 MAG: hypothetical protein DWQ36_10775 [Acidobacteriota bacterium]
MTEPAADSDSGTEQAKPKKRPPRRKKNRRAAAGKTSGSASGKTSGNGATSGDSAGAPESSQASRDDGQQASGNNGDQSTGQGNGSPSRRRRRGSARGRQRETRKLGLHQRSSSHFRPEDRQRGAKYFMQGRVQLDVHGNRARALVDGTERDAYGVGIDWSRVADDRVLHVYCQCERFAGGTPCKHLWATLLELSSNQPQHQPDGKDRLSLRKDRANQWQEFELIEATQSSNGSGSKSQQGQQNQQNHQGQGSKKNRRTQRSRKNRRRRGGAVTWRHQLDSVVEQIEQWEDEQEPDERTSARHLDELEVLFLLNTTTSEQSGDAEIDLFGRRTTPEGKPAKLKRISLTPEDMARLLEPYEPGSGDTDGVSIPDPLHFVSALPTEPPKRPQRQGRGRAKGKQPPGGIQRLRIPAGMAVDYVPDLCERGLLHWWDGRAVGDPHPLRWEDADPWQLALHLEFAAAKRLRLRAVLERRGGSNGSGRESVSLSKPVLILADDRPIDEADEIIEGDHHRRAACLGLVFLSDRVGPLALVPGQDMAWIDLLRENGELMIPEDDLEEAVTTLLELPALPRLQAPDELQLTQEGTDPIPRLKLEPEDTPEWMNPQLVAELSFRYGATQIDAGDPRAAVVDWEERSFVRRDLEGERRELVRLLELGFKPLAGGKADGLEIDPKELPRVAEPLLAAGWEVEAHGISMRPPKPPRLKVESNLDWFELSGQVEFAGDQVDFSRILQAIAKGERTVDLEDGSKGLLPESWMDTYDSLAKLAQSSTEEGLRFLPSQALLVDALLAAMPPVDVDREFAELRGKLRTFESIEAQKEPRGFGGKLRSYQQMGLGWLMFLREFGLGGVLADDMGLGKTVQTLALLKKFRTPKTTSGKPYLVVAPRSLVYNWKQEAERFVPSFKTVEYSGPDREDLKETITDYDLVITTYGTLRRDISYLATVEFDTVILDEAQAIKNPESQTAKACRLLVADHRLALTGTPIENHLGELGSIFEFLNPGLLGRLPALDALASGRQASKEELALVAQGIRPFILRRTKREVLPDLPEKTEQVLQCELNDRQRELYDQLRVSYRESLLQQVEDKGVGGSAMQVLEALLRLRQIACHPGLVNEEWNDAGSAKLESLFERVSEVREEGHKVVIFSQFTKLLAYVRRELDAQDRNYAYLDGQTKNRGEVVDRFQNDDDCNLFLISLKAGGVGLNLTAASYVFLLDPWWNPAVEAQAIDRAHRIGQTQAVFAYRLIARDTVEEKMLELQKSKRQLADAILDGEGQSLRDLTADDLRMLLS